MYILPDFSQERSSHFLPHTELALFPREVDRLMKIRAGSNGRAV